MPVWDSNRHFCAPVPGSSAIISLKGVQKTRLLSTKSCVAWNFESAIVSRSRRLRSPVRNSHASYLVWRYPVERRVTRPTAITAPVLPAVRWLSKEQPDHKESNNSYHVGVASLPSRAKRYEEAVGMMMHCVSLQLSYLIGFTILRASA